MVARVKMSLFLKLIRAHLCILIRKKYFNFQDQTENFVIMEATIIMKATIFYLLMLQSVQRKRFWNKKICFSGDFSANNMKKKTGLNGCLYNVSVDYSFLVLVILSISINI